ncbi:fungal-specific transcription factor domain-containing protein [Apiospora rasikravindrae]|uniref:Fungal-specific transcription factor domain-containing protein n=1 Tax=Apiospora rasikravindrae TaxID=990691 RepID=A0ABR1TZT8_9PEZI
MASPHFVQVLPPTSSSTSQLPHLPQYAHYQQQQQQQQQQPPPQPPASVTSPNGSVILTPTSANTIYSSPTSSFHVKNEVDDRDGSLGVADASEPSRKKQKRNKPTLSCHECVERKTKTRSICIKRQTECQYAHVANLLEETTRSATNSRRMTKPPKKKMSSVDLGDVRPPVPNIADRGLTTGRITAARGSVALSTGLLSNVPWSLPTASNVFGIGSEHPFANYWTCEGGLPEVIGVMPEKMQADMLLGQYFECVDPIYPMIHRQTFYADYEHFWSLPQAEKERSDAALVALIFVMLAMGTQFVTSTNPRDHKQTAEFYASASNQALRMSSYLSTASIRSVQAMVLICYFLINDNHASDGWAFAGILMRQAYAMGLHRDPKIVTPDATPFEKTQRRKLWQAVLLQDTFMTVLLSLPPSATHNDVNVEDLTDDSSSIASEDPTDTAYIRGSWTLANLVQETICSPRSLDLPICATQRQKSKLIGDFRAVYRSFPDVFRSWDTESLAHLAATNKRIVRQTLFLTSNYYHNLMLVHASESPDVPVNVRAALEAAHEAITAFFMLYTLFDHDARVWWVFNHRAFLEALCIGNLLRDYALKESNAAAAGVPMASYGVDGGGGGTDIERAERDPVFARARADITRMLNIMKVMGDEGSDVARTRVAVLSHFLGYDVARNRRAGQGEG